MSPSDIKQLRADLGWTLRQMAGHMGLDHSTIANWESGHRRPDAYRLHTLEGLRQHLDVAIKNRRRDEMMEALGVALLAYGAVGLLRFVFGSKPGDKP